MQFLYYKMYAYKYYGGEKYVWRFRIRLRFMEPMALPLTSRPMALGRRTLGRRTLGHMVNSALLSKNISPNKIVDTH